LTRLQIVDFSWTGLVDGARTAIACLGGHGGMLECQQIWTWLVLAIVVVALGAMILVGRHLIRDYLRHRAAIKRWKADQVVASDVEMSKVKWRGDQSEGDGRSQQELAAEIKQALDKNKAGNEQA
jgi:hypothetical protein